MDLNEYLVGQLVRNRLVELRVEAHLRALASEAAGPKRPLRVVLGQALIRLGRLVLGPAQPERALARP